MGLLNVEITITLLEDMGLIVERVEDGIQCVAKMEQMPAKSYDLILMDMGKIGIVTPMSKALVETVKRATDGEFPTDSINSKLEQIKAMFENKGINPYDTLAWEISHRYRAKNSYGGYAITNCTYHFNKDISDIISVETK